MSTPAERYCARFSLSELYVVFAAEITELEKTYTRESILAAMADGYERYRPSGEALGSRGGAVSIDC